MKLSLFVPYESPEPHLTFAAQIGADCVYTWLPESHIDYDSIVAFRDRCGSRGLELYNAGCIALGKNPSIHLGLADRDAEIERFRRFVTELGRAGVSVTTFTWEPDQVWSSAPGVSRGARSRSVDTRELARAPYTRGRRYEREELWDNFSRFIESLSPTLEEAGVRLALHPNDPPVDGELGGVPCLIRSIADYERAFALAPAGVLGMEFCCGCWLEGGDSFGDPAVEIRRFVSEDRVLVVHLRNVTAPVPEFTETFLDNGYGAMPAILDALAETGYSGSVTPDHVPELIEPYGRGASMAFAAGYIRGVLQHRGDDGA